MQRCASRHPRCWLAGGALGIPSRSRAAIPAAAPPLPSNPQFKVAVLGAAGGIGQPLSLLMKLSPYVSELSLYDVVNTPGVAVDLSHINTACKVRGYVGAAQLGDALTGCQLVIIPAGALSRRAGWRAGWPPAGRRPGAQALLRLCCQPASLSLARPAAAPGAQLPPHLGPQGVRPPPSAPVRTRHYTPSTQRPPAPRPPPPCLQACRASPA
jgi:hypothetical protein